jgi:hypothetical protein
MKAVRKVRVAPGGHRHTPPGTHEHEFEPQRGLPEALPAGEHVLWQGSPEWRELAISRFHVRKLAIYFGVLLAARVSDGMPLGPAVAGSVALFVLAALALGAMALWAWFVARTTVYTLTDKRVVMRIGIVLTITLNLPFKRVEGAALHAVGGQGVGDIALQMLPGDRVAYVHLWPHARRWHFTRPQPTLLCVADAAAVAQRLTGAWSEATGEAGAATSPVAAPGAQTADRLTPHLATR